MTTLPAISMPEVSPREARLQAIVIALVEAGSFREAADVLNGYLREVATRDLRHIESVFAKWQALDPEIRPDFLTYAHHRRNPSIEVNA